MRDPCTLALSDDADWSLLGESPWISHYPTWNLPSQTETRSWILGTTYKHPIYGCLEYLYAIQPTLILYNK